MSLRLKLCFELLSEHCQNRVVLQVSLSDAERAKDQIQDVIIGRRTGDFIERPQGIVEVQQKHFMRNSIADRDSGVAQSRNRGAYQI